jgi:hypothetical protein
MSGFHDFLPGRRIEDDLNAAGPVAQINENKAAVVPANVDPAAKRNLPPLMLTPQIAAVVSSLQFSSAD